MMNKNVLLRNERRKKGWSQKMLADFAMVSLSTIERAERGEPLRIDNIERICKCLEKSPTELGLVDIGSEAAPFNREKAIATRSQTAILPSMTTPIISNATPALMFSTNTADLIDFGMLARLERAFSPRPKVDISTLQYMQGVKFELNRQFVQDKGTNWHSLFQTAINQLNFLTNLLESPIERSEEIVSLIGEACLLAGDVLFNLHHCDLAKGYYEMTLRAAQEAHNASLQVVACGRYGLLLVDAKEYHLAEQLLDQAIPIAEHSVSSSVCSWLWAVKAEAYAGKRDAIACYHALDAAKTELEHNQQRSDCYIFDPSLVSSVYGKTKLFGFEGACYLRLGHAKQAQQVLAASQQLSSHPHHQSLIHVDFAQSFIQQGSPKEACASASEALKYIRETGSQRVFQRIQTIREELHQWQHLAEVNELDEQIALFTPTGA